MTTTIQTTQLDFASIKGKLKTYFEQQSEFADYDFEGSGLSNILDVLAYNSHYNALFANFGLNEAYLDTAQLRSSVVSLANTLGYNIRSRTASIGIVTLTLNLSGAAIKPTSITLPTGTKFTASVDDISYSFQTREALTASNDNGYYTFVNSLGSNDISIYEGTSRTKTFIVNENDERQIFVIPDKTIDTSQVDVRVYDTYNSSSYTSYTDIDDAVSISSTSTHYRLVETPNGYYELGFGDGASIGIKPTVGNKVTIEYLSNVGSDANAATTFIPTSQVTVNSEDYTLGVVTVSASYGGDAKQTIESIRQNAPLGFAAQKRLVTAEDYQTTIQTRHASVSDVVAWGGEDNIPANYGVVYVGLLFDDGVTTASQTAIKDDITSVLNENRAVLSIDIEYVDPVITYLEIETEFDFNPNLTGLTQSSVETTVFSTIQSYVDTNLKTFTGTFRKSNLQTEIDEISNAILSSEIEVKLQQRLTPITTATTDTSSASATYDIYFPDALAAADDVNYRITSSKFYYDSKICSIKNQLSSTKLQIIDGAGNVVVDNIGSYTPTTAHIQLVGFAPGVILSGDAFIKIKAVPLTDNVIKPLRNYYLDIDTSVSYATSNVDRQTTQVTLS